MKWTIIACISLVILWLFPQTSKIVEERSASPTIPARTTCPNETEIPTPLPAAVTTDETFFIVGSLSSPLSPIMSGNSPHIRHSGPGTVFVDDGLCFSHSGSRGGLTIVSKLLQYRITHFTIDNSAVDRITYCPYHPREGTLWGLIEGDIPSNLTTRSVHAISEKAAYVMLGTFCFDPASSTSQTYAAHGMAASYAQLKFSVFYLEIENNWGGSHTCLCHIKLHGE